MAEFLQQCGSWGVLTTLAAYAAGVWVNRKTGKALFNPCLLYTSLRTCVDKLLRLGHWVGVVDGHLVVIALIEPHGLTAAQIDEMCIRDSHRP